MIRTFSGRDDKVGRFGLQNQHRIAITEETILLFDCLVVGVADQFVAAKRADENQQSAARQVKIREQGVNYLELISGRDEQIGFSAPRFQFAFRGGSF